MGGTVRSVGFNWLLQRITALILGAGLLVHFFVLHFANFANKGDRLVTFDMVKERLSQPCWVAFDIVLLACALYHAFNGLRGVVMDYAPGAGARKTWTWVLWLVGLAAFVFGVLALVPFSGGK